MSGRGKIARAPFPGLAPAASPVLAFAAAVVAAAALLAAAGWIHDPVREVTDADSLMRLVEVRAFADGRGWFDLVEPRLLPADGVPLHWSRLVDLPMALILALFRPLLGVEGAELALLNLWPPLLALPFAAALAALAHRLGGWRAAGLALVIAALSPQVTALFRPGSLDHHNVQAVLVLAMAAMLVRADRGMAAGALAGVAASLSLAVGLETIVLIAAGAGGLAAAFVADGARWRAGLAGFGLAVAGCVPALLAATVEPARWLPAACDAISPVYAAVAMVGGLGGAVIAVLPAAVPPTGADRLIRGGLVAALGSLLLALVALVAPQCLAGPYGAVDPQVKAIFLDQVTEAQSFVRAWRGNPGEAIALAAGPVAALLLALAALPRALPAARPGFWILLGMTVGAVLVGSLQVRGLVPAQALAAALAGAAAAEFRRRAETGGAAALPVRLVWLAAAPLAWALLARPFADEGAAVARAEGQRSLASCRAEILDAVSTLPPGPVVAPSNLGSFILANTGHAVLAAPYHRHAAGLLLADRIMTAPPAEAARLAAGAGLLALCRSDKEVALLAARAPDGLVPRLLGGERFGWMRPLAETADTLVFALSPADAEVTGSIAPPLLRPSLP